MVSEALEEEPPVNRAMILASLMTAVIMTALDTTIANVALPHMAGSVSASAEQITWVLTSYIIASAIVTPLSGWLAGRLGRKRVFLISVAGFTAASALCGAAQNLPQIVLFRILQGMLGASLAPLSQAVILDTYSMEERGTVMAFWGMGVMVAPITGPVLGGWLTDHWGWRWVFYINLPLGVLCTLGVMTFVQEKKHLKRIPLDIMGFGLFSIMIAALQLFLDRGQTNDWFQSSEIVIEASVAALALVLFAFHMAAADRPFIPPALLADGNFAASNLLGFVSSMMVFSVLTLLAPMTETVMGYPVITTGLVTAPRGVGSMLSMFLAGRLVGRVDNRILISVGLSMYAWAFLRMSHFSLDMGSFEIASTGLVQGLGTGFMFMPMTTTAFLTLDPELRAEAAGVYTLTRNIGASIGISIMQTVLARNTTVVHARLVEPLRPDNPLAQAPYLAAPYSLTHPLGMAVLDNEVTRQASMVAYVDVFHLMFVCTVAMIPLAFLLRTTRSPTVSRGEVVAE